MSPHLTSEFMGMESYAPNTLHELLDDEVESDGSSIGDVAPSHRPSRECAMADAPEQPLGVTESSRTHAPLGPHGETPELTHEHGEDLQRQWPHQPPTAPARSAHHTVPRAHRPVNGARGHARQVQRNTPIRGTDPRSSLGPVRTLPLR